MSKSFDRHRHIDVWRNTLAFDYGAAREYLRDGIHGAALRDGDDAGFIDAVVRLGRDDVLRGAMRMAARAAVAGLRPDQVAADFDALLQDLAAGRKRHEPLAIA